MNLRLKGLWTLSRHHIHAISGVASSCADDRRARAAVAQ